MPPSCLSGVKEHAAPGELLAPDADIHDQPFDDPGTKGNADGKQPPGQSVGRPGSADPRSARALGSDGNPPEARLRILLRRRVAGSSRRLANQLEVAIVVQKVQLVVLRARGDQNVGGWDRDASRSTQPREPVGGSPNLGARRDRLDIALEIAQQIVLRLTARARPELQQDDVAEDGSILGNGKLDGRPDLGVTIRAQGIDPGRRVDQHAPHAQVSTLGAPGLELLVREEMLAGPKALDQLGKTAAAIELGDRRDHGLALGGCTRVANCFLELIAGNIHGRLHAPMLHPRRILNQRRVPDRRSCFARRPWCQTLVWGPQPEALCTLLDRQRDPQG